MNTSIFNTLSPFSPVSSDVPSVVQAVLNMERMFGTIDRSEYTRTLLGEKDVQLNTWYNIDSPTLGGWIVFVDENRHAWGVYRNSTREIHRISTKTFNNFLATELPEGLLPVLSPVECLEHSDMKKAV